MGAPSSFKSAMVNARGYPEARFTLQFYVEDCTGCGLCVEACPAISPREPDVKAINLADKEGLIPAERANIAFFETIAGERSFPGRFRQGTRHPVPRTAVRISRRLCRMRRDTLSQAALATIWRPGADRQRHRVLVHLRRQSPGDALDQEPRGPRPSLVELPVRGQCRVRAGLSSGRRQASRSCQVVAGQARTGGRRGTRGGHPECTTDP